MSRVRATLPDGRSVLYEVRCDGTGCEATLKPGPHAVASGWRKVGRIEMGDGGREHFMWDYCPACAARIGV